MASSSIILPSTSQREPVISNIDKRNIPCKFYKLGCCHYGNGCRFLHTETQITSTSTDLDNQPSSSTNIRNIPNKWVLAPVFVPTQRFNTQTENEEVIDENDTENSENNKSYAEVVNNDKNNMTTDKIVSESSYEITETVLCPYLMKSGFCRYETCTYNHYELCEWCGKYCLDPFDTEQRKQHNRDCIADHERKMNIAFATQRSQEKQCGICMDIVWEKDGREQRFGILPNCVHCFCLECIRTWRQAKQFDNKIIRSCPECRIRSDFVCPSSFWVESPEEKEKLITKYKEALSDKDCKYFLKGTGRCPFANKCFYKHALANGSKIDVGEPQRPNRQYNSLGNLEQLQSLIFWDFIEGRLLNEDLFSDSEDSSLSDFIESF